MRILHVWDCAGVSGCLAKYQRKLGHDVTVICRDGYDGFKQKEFYGVKIIGPKRRRFKDFGLLQKPLRLVNRTLSCIVFYGWIALNSYRFDMVHIHSTFLVDFFLPFKHKVVEFHGDDVRGSPSKRWLVDVVVTNFYLKLRRGRRFLVSTPDMKRELKSAVWLPNPVDTEIFNPSVLEGGHGAVYFHNWYEDGDHAKEYASLFNMDLIIVDRVKLCHLFYPDMPMFLGGFDLMIDRSEIPSLSKTALEALACGLKVLDWKGNVLEGLPDYHKPEYVAQLSLSLYGEVMKK